VYGQIDYAFTEQLTGTLGLRYTDDTKDGGNPERLLYDPKTNTPFIGFPQSWEYDESWDEWTGKIGLAYHFSDNSMLYASYSKGFKSGGVNTLGIAYKPETIYAGEIGSKNRFFDDRLEMNVAMFYSEYENMQLFTVRQTATVVENASDSTIQGFEIESDAAINEYLRLEGTLAYLDAEFGDFVTSDPTRGAPGRPPAPPEDLSGNKLPRSPEWQMSVAAELGFDLQGGRLTFRGEYYWQDETYFRAFNREEFKQDSYGILNLWATYLAPDETWRISAFGKNLSDEQYATNVFLEALFFGAPPLANIGPPRTWGIELGYRFR